MSREAIAERYWRWFMRDYPGIANAKYDIDEDVHRQHLDIAEFVELELVRVAADLAAMDDAIDYFDQKADASQEPGESLHGNVEMDLQIRLEALREKLAGGGA